MAAFNVTKVDLTDWGYPESVDFGDPMSKLFSAKPYAGASSKDQLENVLLPYFQNLDAYPDAESVIKALDDYNKNEPKSKSSTMTSATPTSTTVQGIAPSAVSTTAAQVSPAVTTFKTSTKTSTTKAKTTTTKKKGKGGDDDDD